MRVVVTGAAGGIGTAAIAELRRRGAQVVGLDLAGADVVCDVRDPNSKHRGRGSGELAVPCAVTGPVVGSGSRCRLQGHRQLRSRTKDSPVRSGHP